MKYLVAALVLISGAAAAQTATPNMLVLDKNLVQAPGFVMQANNGGGVRTFSLPTGFKYVCFGATGPFYACNDSALAPRCSTTRPTGNVTNGTAWDVAPTCYSLSYVNGYLADRLLVDPGTADVSVKVYR